jgi:hypothetical protein
MMTSCSFINKVYVYMNEFLCAVDEQERILVACRNA